MSYYERRNNNNNKNDLGITRIGPKVQHDPVAMFQTKAKIFFGGR